ncbi:cytochrome P450 [Sinobacterium caligoides]|uniref:Cytochrome P450 n=1 Tax=Sinobacterium caligoides TaxID=933926 RepID=A0A3N2DGX5_9GAMM|nr:cytochrome P450 [Sinobacterium caligoides]ROR99057.1 cytochrome P450 [Sinobacterium caligoides]
MGIKHVDFIDFQTSYENYCNECRVSGELIKLDVPGELNMYVVSDHPGVNEVLKNEAGHMVHFADFFETMEKASETDQKIGEIFSRNLGNNSGMHLELRKDIRNHFNGGGVDQHIGYIRQTIADLVPALEAKAKANNGIVDLSKDFTMPLTFLVTAHILGLEFANDTEKKDATEWAGEAIQLINLIAPEEVKISALAAHDKLSSFILPQLRAFVEDEDSSKRDNCLFYDFAKKLRLDSEKELMVNYIELVNGLFQAGLGATGNFLALCLNLVLSGDEHNDAEEIKSYFLASERSDEEKREAIAEYIRVAQKQLGGMLPRFSKQGGPLMGHQIEPNSLIYMSFISANLDENAFAEPLKINPARTKIPAGLSRQQLSERRAKRQEKNVSFSYGEHMCPGRRIALTIIRHAMDELFALYPNMEAIDLNIQSELFGKPAEVTSFNIKLNN